MFQFMRGVALIAAMFVSGEAAFAEDPSSANYYMPACRKSLDDSPASYREGLCLGAIGTILYFDRALGICSPLKSNIGQFISVVVKYIDERPARMHENFRELSLEALRAAWPCK